MIIVDVHHLFKTFGEKTAINDVSFSIEASRCYGFLGPNGAGKTTTLRTLYGLINPDARPETRMQVFGLDPRTQAEAIKSVTGIVPQENSLDAELNVRDNLLIYARLQAIPRRKAEKRIDELLDFMELQEKKKAQVQTLSGGMQRRLAIARALINRPQLLILDEPTTGLDPQVRKVIWAKLQQLMATGVTILLTTHYMEEAYRICDHIFIVDQGKQILEGKPQSLIKDNIESHVLELKSTRLLEHIKDMPASVRVETAEEGSYLFSSSLKDLESLLSSIPEAESHNYIIRHSNLEDLFLKTTGRTLND